MCELLVGLPEVDVLGVGQSVDGIVRDGARSLLRLSLPRKLG